MRMDFNIVSLKEEHREQVVSMMRDFYSSPAVLSNGSEEIFEADVSACVGDNPFIEGFVFEKKEASGESVLMGYAMLSKGFSTESGKNRIWIEDLYICEKFRGFGIGKRFLNFVDEKYENCVVRLDVEEENEKAVELYKKCGFEVIPYMEMIKNS